MNVVALWLVGLATAQANPVWDVVNLDTGNQLTTNEIQGMDIQVEQENQCFVPVFPWAHGFKTYTKVSGEDRISCYLVQVGMENKQPPISRVGLDVSFGEQILSVLTTTASLDATELMCRGGFSHNFGNPHRGLEKGDLAVLAGNDLGVNSEVFDWLIPDQVRVITRCTEMAAAALHYDKDDLTSVTTKTSGVSLKKP